MIKSDAERTTRLYTSGVAVLMPDLSGDDQSYRLVGYWSNANFDTKQPTDTARFIDVPTTVRAGGTVLTRTDRPLRGKFVHPDTILLQAVQESRIEEPQNFQLLERSDQLLEDLGFISGMYRVVGTSGVIEWEGIIGLVTSPFLTGPSTEDPYHGVVRVEIWNDRGERVTLGARLFERDGDVWTDPQTLSSGMTGWMRGRVENGQVELRLLRSGGYVRDGMVQEINLRGSRLN
ncbi:MAG TPA: hypothetical protein VLK84_14675 [Longimicrobium sp.]|nr:hypothetical protein [Longimicrobium sp.]